MRSEFGENIEGSKRGEPTMADARASKSGLTNDRMDAMARTHVQAIADNSPRQVVQRQVAALAEFGKEAAEPQPRAAGAAPVQLSRGSKQANQDLINSMGKSASRVDKLPNAKSHTKKGTGRGGGGTDHEGRNSNVINKAKQDTRKAHDDPTMFSASRMRTDDNAEAKFAAAEEKRTAKAASKKKSFEEELEDYYDKPFHQITKDDIRAYKEAMDV